MKNFYKKSLVLLLLSFSIFGLTLNNTNALKIKITEKNEAIFNMSEFKLFYKIKYLQYVIFEKQKIIELQELNEKTWKNDIYINQEKFKAELYGENVNVILKMKINKILENIFLEKSIFEKTKKMMSIYEKAEKISMNTENKSIKDAMQYLKIRIALNF